jgi:hypothetical protein
MKKFKPDSVTIPSGIETKYFRVRILTVNDVAKDYDAMVRLWVRQSEIKNGLDKKLFSAVKIWLSEEWWFTTIAFPGRQLSWQEWESLPDK